MDLFNQNIIEQSKILFAQLENLSIESKVDAINAIRKMLHSYSPFKREPVDLIQWVRNETVEANDYNPNSVAPPEMKLLEISILEDGFTQPIVTYDEGFQKTVVDGFHRNRVGKESSKVRERVHGYLPVVIINQDRADKSDRIAATIRHNRARGKHKVDAMSEIVVDLKRRNWSDDKIARELGMDSDEVLRLSQISGIAEMFQDKEFSEAWEVNSVGEDETLEISQEIE
jgi:ParB-like chromosome segregation protein Spo0J